MPSPSPVGRAMSRLRSRAIRIAEVERRESTQVEEYWAGHTVNSTPFASAEESERYLEWRFEEYPLYREFMGLWGDHRDEVVLDYGCGPGNDVIGFLLHSHATRVIGVDISAKALELARGRLVLHSVAPKRVRLLSISDADPRLPLDAGSVDYFQASGVLQHTSEPEAILSELRRVVRPSGSGRVMVYNWDSVWLHLYTAYAVRILDGKYRELDIRDAFARTTDGEDCPLARCYRPAEFGRLCEGAGFRWEYVGGYPARHELACLATHYEAAIACDSLEPVHREFLRTLHFDDEGRPMRDRVYAGVGGVYRLWPS